MTRNSLSTTSELDSSNRMAGYSWILIPAGTALHFLPPRFAPAFCHRAHASFGRKRYLPPIQSIVHDSNKQRGVIESRDASPMRYLFNANGAIFIASSPRRVFVRKSSLALTARFTCTAFRELFGNATIA